MGNTFKRSLYVINLDALLEGYEGWTGAGQIHKCKDGYYTSLRRQVVGTETETHTVHVFRQNRKLYFDAPADMMEMIDSVVWEKKDLPMGYIWGRIHHISTLSDGVKV